MSRFFKKKGVPTGKFRLQLFFILSLTLVFLFPPKHGLANGRFKSNNVFASDQNGFSVKDTIKPQTIDVAGEQQSSRSISGTVKDNKGIPIPGATIIVKGTTIGVTTSLDGIFTLKLPANAKTIVFTFVGMKSQEIEVGTKATFPVVLLDETLGLDEVVVIGYGSLQKKELTSSITSVSSKDFLEGSANNAMQVINGKVAGLSVSSSAPSDPNAGVSLQIRGASSIKAGTGPLVVID